MKVTTKYCRDAFSTKIKAKKSENARKKPEKCLGNRIWKNKFWSLETVSKNDFITSR